MGEIGGAGWRSWSACASCGFEGIMTFRARPGEDYSDPEALAVMMETCCPACEAEETVLVTVEEYRNMLREQGEGPR